MTPSLLYAEIIGDAIGVGRIDAEYCLHACNGKPCGYKIADPNDCAGYFICYNDIIQQKHCQLGEIFNAVTQQCVVGSCPPCSCDNCQSTTTQTSTTSNDTTTENPAYIPNCLNAENGQRFPDVLHCRLFWQCRNGQAVQLFCERGMWYDRERFVCNFPALVKNCPANQN